VPDQPCVLNGGDRALYDLLSEQFDVQMVAVTIFRHHDRDYSHYILSRFLRRCKPRTGHQAAAKKPSTGPTRTRLLLLNHIQHIVNEGPAEKTARTL